MGDTLRGGTSLYCELLTLTPDRAVVRDMLNQQSTFELDINARIYDALRDRVGTEIGLTGRAEWRISDMVMVSFEVEDVLPYRKVPLTEAMASLREVIGDAFDKLFGGR